MRRCEDCPSFGRTREGYAHRLRDGQRVSLCLSCASRWRIVAPDMFPVPYGPAARAAQAANSIVGQVSADA